MSQPVVPQRPSRSPHPPVSLDEPKVPPRPTRKFERSLSRDRENYARSPLNESPFQAPSAETASKPAIRRPPSVASLPLVGQEGLEYASLEDAQPTATSGNDVNLVVPNTTSSVASDLPLHAPKASASAGTTSRLAEVTRADSATGITASSPVSRPRSTLERPSSSISKDRPGSAAEHRPWETFIPEIGVRVPMYPNAGDVQAPTPGPGSSAPSTGVGYFNSGSRPATSSGPTVGRRKSTQFQAPPDSYGLHGHGVGPQDQFEKSWYQKHPDEARKEEHGAYGPAVRGEQHDWTMSSEQLNRLVRDSALRQNGTSATPEALGTPTEQIGYMATEKYASRSNSPKPLPLHKTTSRTAHSRTGSGTHAESPLRTASFAEEILGHQQALDSEDESVHVDAPAGRSSKYAASGYEHPVIDLGPRGGNTSHHGGWIQEDGSGTPILASDEIAKNPQAWLMPAVSPEAEKHSHDEEYFSGVDERGIPKYERGYRSHSRSRSRNEGNSRPSSLHGASGLSRFISHDEGAGTPLEEIEEFEPLFEEDDNQPVKKPATAADKLKRPELEHRFPSRDIWEDTPDSLRLETTVDTPEEPAPAKVSTSAPASAMFETPEQEALRKGEHSLPKPKLNSAVQADVAAHRPGMRQRFPSSDIWEDTPDSQMFTTTVGEEQLAREANAEKPAVPTRPTKAHPSIPPRPSGLAKQTSPTERQGPTIPDRPKPKIGTERDIDVEPATGPSIAAPKAKPAVPARPAAASAKFASIKSSFMNDLNSRLQLGPKPPAKSEEVSPEAKEEDAAPLADARKGRARGPARRKPAASPSGEASAGALSIFAPVAVWSISPTADLVVDSYSTQTITPGSAKIAAAALPSDDGAPKHDSTAAEIAAFEERRIGHAGDVPNEPVPTSSTPILAADAALAQTAPSSLPAAIAPGQLRDSDSPVPALRELDRKDSATPDLIDADAEAERQRVLAKLPAAANITPAADGVGRTVGRPLTGDAADRSVQEGGDVVVPEQ
ncbi:hypothetical protein FH972_021683 [Carpinus fangiana]|uniref:Altered inheritance of mitochondria protein 21 n=1 Tax=Carpinus fangiana TaxID=176857 RepID=A0A5N6KQE3_9ROSI|nr:hypothetical protein FH972_021683 [Carpinus fangiana]